jgi:TRAP-type mannitol/chloroaromatic compound transport system substrate-binding protein
MLSEFEARNNEALKELIDVHKVQLRKYPDSVLKQLKKYALEVVEEVAAKDPMSRKAYDSYLAFQKNIFEWNKLTEEPYHALKYL